MKNPRINVEILFTSSKALEPVHEEVRLSKYRIKTVPTVKKSFTDTTEKLSPRVPKYLEERSNELKP